MDVDDSVDIKKADIMLSGVLTVLITRVSEYYWWWQAFANVLFSVYIPNKRKRLESSSILGTMCTAESPHGYHCSWWNTLGIILFKLFRLQNHAWRVSNFYSRRSNVVDSWTPCSLLHDGVHFKLVIRIITLLKLYRISTQSTADHEGELSPHSTI